MRKEKQHIEQNPRREILLETSLFYSVFKGNNSLFLSLFCFSFFFPLDVGVVPASKELFFKLSFYAI